MKFSPAIMSRVSKSMSLKVIRRALREQLALQDACHGRTKGFWIARGMEEINYATNQARFEAKESNRVHTGVRSRRRVIVAGRRRIRRDRCAGRQDANAGHRAEP
jgi:hypothetical protein